MASKHGNNGNNSLFGKAILIVIILIIIAVGISIFVSVVDILLKKVVSFE